MCQRNNIDKIYKVVERKNDKGTKSCHEVPKVVKRAKLQTEGDEQQKMVWISFWIDKKLVCNVGMVRFHVGSFLSTLVDFGAVRNLGEIGFVKFELQAKDDESEVEI